MILPIHDDNPRTIQPWFSWAILTIQVAGAWVAFFAHPLASLFAIGPTELVSNHPSKYFFIPAFLYIAFIGGCLWVFADNLEDRLGRLGFLALYVMSGLMGALAEDVVTQSPDNGFAVASTSAVISCYVFLFPKRPVTFIYPSMSRGTEQIVGMGSVRASWALPTWLSAQMMTYLLPVVPTCPAATLIGLVIGGATGYVGSQLRPDNPYELEELIAGSGFERLSDVPIDPNASKKTKADTDEEPVGDPGPIILPPLPAADPSIAAPAPEGFDWAVIRVTDELRDVGALGRKIQKKTGELLYDVTRRLRTSRGILVPKCSREEAMAWAEEFTHQGTDCAAVRWDPNQPGPNHVARSVAWTDRSIAFELGDGALYDFAWRQCALFVGAQLVDEELRLEPSDDPQSNIAVTRVRKRAWPLIECYVRSRKSATTMRLRCSKHQTRFLGNAGDRQGILGFADAILRHRGATPMNAGVQVIANRGTWGHLHFDLAHGLEEYSAWLLHVMQWHRQQSGEQLLAPSD